MTNFLLEELEANLEVQEHLKEEQMQKQREFGGGESRVASTQSVR